MTDFETATKQAIKHLRDGEIQLADDLLTHVLTQHAAAQAAAAGLMPSPPPPRAPNAVLLEALNVMLGLFGTPPKLETLIKELEQVL